MKSIFNKEFRSFFFSGGGGGGVSVFLLYYHTTLFSYISGDVGLYATAALSQGVQRNANFPKLVLVNGTNINFYYLIRIIIDLLTSVSYNCYFLKNCNFISSPRKKIPHAVACAKHLRKPPKKHAFRAQNYSYKIVNLY